MRSPSVESYAKETSASPPDRSRDNDRSTPTKCPSANSQRLAILDLAIKASRLAIELPRSAYYISPYICIRYIIFEARELHCITHGEMLKCMHARARTCTYDRQIARFFLDVPLYYRDFDVLRAFFMRQFSLSCRRPIIRRVSH